MRWPGRIEQVGASARWGYVGSHPAIGAMDREQGKPGFTLIEVILVILLIGILAGLAANLLTNTLDQARFDEAQKKMTVLSNAMVGNPDLMTNGVRSDFGFVGDIGRLPTALTELVTQGALPAWSAATGVGWQGPYVPGDFAQNPDGYRADGWGTLFTYASATGVVTSLGSDGAAGGTGYAADFSTPDLTAPTDQRVGTITGRVTDLLGSPLASVTGGTVTVSVTNNPVAGAATTVSTTTGADGSYSLSPIIVGRRTVQVTVTTGAATTYPAKVAIVTPTQPAQVESRCVDLEWQAKPTGLGPRVGGLVVKRDFEIGPGLVAVKDKSCCDGGQVGRGGGFHDGINRCGSFLEAQLEILWRSGLVRELIGRRLLGLVEVSPDVARPDVVGAPLHGPVFVEALVKILAQAETVGVAGQLAPGALVH